MTIFWLFMLVINAPAIVLCVFLALVFLTKLFEGE